MQRYVNYIYILLFLMLNNLYCFVFTYYIFFRLVFTYPKRLQS